jgi:ATP-dependent DNA helicase RecG
VKRPGIRADEIAKAIKKAKPTAERYIKRLRDAHVIEFKGAPKTGGYFVTMKINRKLKRRSLK